MTQEQFMKNYNFFNYDLNRFRTIKILQRELNEWNRLYNLKNKHGK